MTFLARPECRDNFWHVVTYDISDPDNWVEISDLATEQSCGEPPPEIEPAEDTEIAPPPEPVPDQPPPTPAGPCDREPCRGALTQFQVAKRDLEAQRARVERFKAYRLANCGGAGGTLLAAGGILAAAGGPVGWIVGGLAAGAGAALSLECIRASRLLRAERATCATLFTAYAAAQNAVMNACPAHCWPVFPNLACP
jgi:hypothetical protein